MGLEKVGLKVIFKLSSLFNKIENNHHFTKLFFFSTLAFMRALTTDIGI